MILDLLLVIVSILVIVCMGLQQPKQGLSDALSGENSELFKQQKERGFESVLSRVTYGLSIAFILLGFAIYLR
mgnify:CR=1 FL=1